MADTSPALRSLKLLLGMICLALVASNLASMSRWSERRGVIDDLCYLRQAHLFQQHGVGGFSTDIVHDTDGYFRRLVGDVGHPEWHTDGFVVCHPKAAATGKLVIQYPPGVGFLLALFPEGYQVIPYHAVAMLLVLGMALLGLRLAQSRAAVVGAGAFGAMALYFMINPTKASYSIAPTMVLCAAVGFMTAKLFAQHDRRQQLLLATLIGLLLGLSVNLRIPNVLLMAGYAGFFLVTFLVARDALTFTRGLLFGASGLIGLSPTLVANAINAGSPLATTYGINDVVPPDFTFSIARDYLGDLQGILILAAIAWSAAVLITRRRDGLWQVAAIVTVNLVVNLGYFLSHPIFTQYYLMPLAMLSLWSLLFAYLRDDRAEVFATGTVPTAGLLTERA